MRRWVRVYPAGRVDPTRKAVAGLMSAASATAAGGAIFQEMGTAAGVAAVGLIGFYNLVIWRTVLVGVYVNGFGVKVRKVAWTRVIPWSRMDRAWAGPAAHHDAWQIWITVRDPERDIETPLWRKGSRDRHGNRIVLEPGEFSLALEALDPRRRIDKA